MKKCCTCKNEFPANTQYFTRENSRKDGLSNMCKSCKSEYGKKYRKENKGKIDGYNKKLWAENKEKEKERIAKWRAENKEHIRQYRKDTREHAKLTRLEWRKTERGKKIDRLKTNRYRAKKRQLENTLTAKEWEECINHFHGKCAYCGEHAECLEQEHFIPVAKNGALVKENIVPACRSCNASKRDSDFFEWYPEQTFYSKERERKVIDYLKVGD